MRQRRFVFAVPLLVAVLAGCAAQQSPAETVSIEETVTVTETAPPEDAIITADLAQQCATELDRELYQVSNGAIDGFDAHYDYRDWQAEITDGELRIAWDAVAPDESPHVYCRVIDGQVEPMDRTEFENPTHT